MNCNNLNLEIIYNYIVPWITIIKFPASNSLVADDIEKFLEAFDNSEVAYNMVPLLAHMIEQSLRY